MLGEYLQQPTATTNALSLYAPLLERASQLTASRGGGSLSAIALCAHQQEEEPAAGEIAAQLAGMADDVLQLQVPKRRNLALALGEAAAARAANEAKEAARKRRRERGRTTLRRPALTLNEPPNPNPNLRACFSVDGEVSWSGTFENLTLYDGVDSDGKPRQRLTLAHNYSLIHKRESRAW